MRGGDSRVLGWKCSPHSGDASYDYVIKRSTSEIERFDIQKARILCVSNLNPAMSKLEPNSGDTEGQHQNLMLCCSANSLESFHSASTKFDDEDGATSQVTKSLESFHGASSSSDDEDGATSQASAVCAPLSSISGTSCHLGDMPLSTRSLRKSSICTSLRTDTSGMARRFTDKALLPHQIQVALKFQRMEDQFSQCQHQLTHLVGKGELGSVPEYLKLCDELTSLCSEALDISFRRDVPGAMDLFENVHSTLEEVVTSMDAHCGPTIAALPMPARTPQSHGEDSEPSSGCRSGSSIILQCFAGVNAAFKEMLARS